jgi:hypothetical protein
LKGHMSHRRDRHDMAVHVRPREVSVPEVLNQDFVVFADGDDVLEEVGIAGRSVEPLETGAAISMPSKDTGWNVGIGGIPDVDIATATLIRGSCGNLKLSLRVGSVPWTPRDAFQRGGSVDDMKRASIARGGNQFLSFPNLIKNIEIPNFHCLVSAPSG